MADVHKVLASASRVATTGGQNFYLTDQGGYSIPRDSAIGRELQHALDMSIRRHGPAGLIPIYMENGVYNFYVRQPQVTPIQSLSPPLDHVRHPKEVRRVSDLP